MPIFDVTQLKNDFTEYLRQKLVETTVDPRATLNIVLIGDDFASHKYVKMKQKFGESIGVKTKFWYFQDNYSVGQLASLLDGFKNSGEPTLVQLPVSSSHYAEVVNIPYQIDVDLLGLESQKLWSLGILPPTIGAIDLIMKKILLQENKTIEELLTSNLSLKGKVVAVVGQGLLVGRPLTQYLTRAGATVISCNVSTPNSTNFTHQADIVIVATGVGGLIGPEWLAEKRVENGVTWPIVVDAGTSEGEVVLGTSSNSVDGDEQIKKVLIGDVRNDEVVDKCTLVGVPGGVGPLTVRYIFWNFYRLMNL